MKRDGQRTGLCCWLIALMLALSTPQVAAARVVLVGVDGGSWNVIDPMLAAGELPNLASIARAGVSAELETVEPVTSPVVWTSIATGRSPEHHGVTDFFGTALSIRTPTVFERLAARGLRVGLYDYLVTWPPASFPGGFVIPGWLRRDDRVSPSDVWTRIDESPWVNAYAPLKTSEEYRENALKDAQRKAARFVALAEAFDLEVGAVSYYGVDATSHRFWHGAFPDEFAPEVAALATDAQRTALRDVLREIDRGIGEIRARLAPEDVLLVASDHGFRGQPDPADVWVSHFESELTRAGLDPDRDGFAILSEFGHLVVRVRPARADGSHSAAGALVEEDGARFDEADATTQRLADLIESYRSPEGDGLFWAAEVIDVAPRPPGRERPLGNRLRQWLVRAALEHVFDVKVETNAHAVIFALPRKGVLGSLAPDTRVRVGGRELPLASAFSRQLFTGEHDPIAIFLAAGGPIQHRSERARISVLDVAPLVFYLAGAPLPDDLEGRLPSEWIAPGHLEAVPVVHAPADTMPGIDRSTPGGGGAADPALLESLRRLGYIE